MSEVRPGGDSSDSIAEMTGPQNLQKTEVNGSMQERHKDNNTTENSDSSITLSSEDAKTKSLQPQFETDTPIVRTDNAEEIDNTATYDRVEAKGSSASIVHIRQLFVGNLPFRVRWQDLKDMFKKAGEVIRADVAIGFDNRSKGHGTVLFTRVEDAQQAVELFHNYNWQGRILEVREDRGFIDRDIRNGYHYRNVGPANNAMKAVQHTNHPMSSTNAHYNNSIYASQTRPIQIPAPNGRQLFVGNIPFNCQWQDLKDLFRNAGNILRADIAQGNDGRSRGFGTVLYATPEDAKNAVALYDGYEYQGRRLRVHFDKFAPSTSTPHPGQGLPEIHGGFQDPMHLRSPFLSRMPYPPLSMPSMPGIHMFQSPSPLPHMRAYINPYTNTSDMIMPPQMPLSNTNMQDSQGLANTEIGPSVSVITQVEQPEQFTSVLTDPANNSIHRPIGLPNARASALGSLDTEVSGLSSYQVPPQTHMNPPAWNGSQHHSLMYRQHPNRTQQPEYPWLPHPLSHSFQPDTFLSTAQAEYMSDQQLYNNSTHDDEIMSPLTDAIASLRFEGTAGLPSNHVQDGPNDNASTKLAPPGIGGIVLGNPMWERQEGSWNTQLKSSFKL